MHARGDNTSTTSGTGPARTRRARAATSAWVACALCVGAAACSGSGRSDESLGRLVVAPADAPVTIDLDRAARDPAELLRAAALPHSVVGELLGPHRLRATSTLVVKEGAETVETLDVETAVDLAGAGAYHAVLDNSADYGRDVYYTGGYLYLRPRYGRYHKRRPNDDGEPAAIVDAIAGDLGAYLELLVPGIEVTAEGTVDVAGRPGRRIAIKKAARQGAIASQPAQRKWRESAQVTSAGGEVVLDAETGAPLRADVRGQVVVVRDGRQLVIQLSVVHELSDIGASIRIEAPVAGDTVSTPGRSTEVSERDQLLRGIAPPTRRDSGSTPARLAPPRRSRAAEE